MEKVRLRDGMACSKPWLDEEPELKQGTEPKLKLLGMQSRLRKQQPALPGHAYGACFLFWRCY